VGQDSERVLKDVLGVTDDDYAGLVAERIVY
jgi:hypothetical protein